VEYLDEIKVPAALIDERIGLTEVDGSVKRGLEEPSLAFNHWVHLPFRALRLCVAPKPGGSDPSELRGRVRLGSHSALSAAFV